MVRILVPFNGGATSMYALDAACRVAHDNGDEVHAAYVLRIPYHLPISADMSAEHARAALLFQHAHAIAGRHNVPLTEVTVEARRVGPGIVEAAHGCDSIMIGLGTRQRFYNRVLLGRTVRYVTAHAPCRVLILCAGDTSTAVQSPVIVSATAI